MTVKQRFWDILHKQHQIERELAWIRQEQKLIRIQQEDILSAKLPYAAQRPLDLRKKGLACLINITNVRIGDLNELIYGSRIGFIVEDKGGK